MAASLGPPIDRRQAVRPSVPSRRALERRARYERTGDRNMLVNSPDGWMTDPRIIQPNWGGMSNPGFHWLGRDDWGLVTPNNTLAAATRAHELVAGSIAAFPWKVKRNDVQAVASPEWIADPQLSRLDGRIASSSFRGWDNRLSPVAFREQILSSLLLRGNAYIFTPVRGSSGQPVPPLFIFHPDDVDIRDGGYWVDGQRLPADAIIHVRGRAPLDEQGRGMGVLEAHAASLGLLGAAVAKVTSAMEAPVPAGVLEVGSGVTIEDDEAKQLREDWERMHAGGYGVGVLNSTITFKPLAWSPEALQLVQLADFGIREVALAFGISPSWLGVPDSSLTYNTVQLKAIELRQFTLLPWVRRIEAVYDSELPRGQELSIVMDGLERADTSARYAAYQTGIQAGFLTVDEARALEGLEPLGQQEVPDE